MRARLVELYAQVYAELEAPASFIKMAPIAAIRPSEVWTRREGYFALLVLILVFGGAFFVPWLLLLAPFFLYRAFHSYQALRGHVGIDVYAERLVLKSPLGKRREIHKSQVLKFLSVYRGTTEVVVARTEESAQSVRNGRRLMLPSDVPMPSGLMRNPGLVNRLESWRLGTFSPDSLFAEDESSPHS